MTTIQLTEGTRYTIMVHTEINRLRNCESVDYFHTVADALGLQRSTVKAWTSRSEWHDLLRQAQSLKDIPRCPNPDCGGPLGHVHDCSDAFRQA